MRELSAQDAMREDSNLAVAKMIPVVHPITPEEREARRYAMDAALKLAEMDPPRDFFEFCINLHCIYGFLSGDGLDLDNKSN